MPNNVQDCWADERVDATVTSQFIHSHLRASEAEQLTSSVFGELSDDTYLEWILTRAKRLFLTLIDAGVPDQIFGLIDESYDDHDLPISEEGVADLRLSRNPNRSLDRRFYRSQFKYLTRIVGEGEHIRYAQEETIPLQSIGGKTVTVTKDALDKVKLLSGTSQVLLRRRLSLDSQRTETNILAEIAAARTFNHDHILSVFGSYTQNENIFVLMLPAAEYSLKSFLNDLPKAFESLSKAQRRRLLITWPHCLSNAVAWLHANGSHHSSIRPSRIHVDEQFRISLGYFEGDWVLGSPSAKDDIEAYQYAAPERWKRAVTVQSSATANVSLPSGGRSGRKMGFGRQEESTKLSNNNDYTVRSESIDLSGPASYTFMPTSKGNFTRLKLGVATRPLPSRQRSLDSRQSLRTDASHDTIRPGQALHRQHETNSTQSSHSNSSGSVRRHRPTPSEPIYAVNPEMRTTVVQTWKSVAHDLPAADVFALAAVMMDIMTIICKKSVSSFAKHRASKNRQAGRGGGLADASFHANLGQVSTWAQSLHKESEKRSKKEEGEIFNVVGPALQVIMQCLDREPTKRMTAESLSTRLQEHLSDFGGINDTHCVLRRMEDTIEPDRKYIKRSKSRSKLLEEQQAAAKAKQRAIESVQHQHPHAGTAILKGKPSNVKNSADSPASSTDSFHYGTDTRAKTLSTTLIDDNGDDNLSAGGRDYNPHQDPKGHRFRSTRNTSRRQQTSVYDEESEESESALSPYPEGTEDTLSYTHFSVSASSANSDDYTLFTEFSAPSSKPPNRQLPDLPSSQTQKKSKRRDRSPPKKTRSSLANVEQATYNLSQAVDSVRDWEAEKSHKNYSRPQRSAGHSRDDRLQEYHTTHRPRMYQ